MNLLNVQLIAASTTTNGSYCTLNQIKIGKTHEQNPKVVECTDCESFELK